MTLIHQFILQDGMLDRLQTSHGHSLHQCSILLHHHHLVESTKKNPTMKDLDSQTMRVERIVTPQVAAAKGLTHIMIYLSAQMKQNMFRKYGGHIGMPKADGVELWENQYVELGDS